MIGSRYRDTVIINTKDGESHLALIDEVTGKEVGEVRLGGYDGFAIFARDMDLAINNPVWGIMKAPF